MRCYAIVLAALAGLATAAQAAPLTKYCNTADTSQIYLEGMTAEVQGRLVNAANDPAREADLSARLWEPIHATTSTSATGARVVLLEYNAFQDIIEIAEALRMDPVIAQFGLTSLNDNKKSCFPTMPPPTLLLATEWKNVILNHFFTASTEAENDILDSGGAGPGWVRTGARYTYVAPDVCYGSQRVFRFYNGAANTHFYTADVSECGGLRQPGKGWVPEGVAFGAQLPLNNFCRENFTTLYRLYNNRFAFNGDSNHRYTSDVFIVQQMAAEGWIPEGKALCLQYK